LTIPLTAYATGLTVGADRGVKSTHHMLAVMKSFIPAGTELTQHVHDYDHDSLLVSGSVILHQYGRMKRIDAPKLIKIPAQVEHKIVSITDAEWWCMHEIDETGNVIL
jgi:quercetin dioxygenase-like cupin family protein